jgi:hypothetical protein
VKLPEVTCCNNQVQLKLQYLALDDLESSVNQKLTNRPITFDCSINWQHPAWILRVSPLIVGILLVFFVDYNSLCYVSSYKKGTESVGQTTGQDIKWLSG